MSVEQPTPGEDGDTNEDGVERIADPEDYTLRRRLRQLHDARQNVREIKDEAFRLEKTHRRVEPQDRDQFVAEALADYICELRVVLERRGDADELLDETVRPWNTDLDSVTIRELREQRGFVEGPSGRVVISYQTAMRAWDKCNSYFEEVAGAELESGGLPTESGFDTTGQHEH